ncbi:P1 family peptidase [Mumia sp. zg.B21]|uniref:P1 family peptidase n=1 Tax=Mumia sp. zg.B21 TaxID=2855447 RepID=UPI002104A68A|nr:P1 family peptidase [Mumia sp. zg.B21]
MHDRGRDRRTARRAPARAGRPACRLRDGPGRRGLRQGSGDYALAFSVGTGQPPADEALDPILGSTMDAVEEALLNSVLAATTTQGRHGRTVLGVPGGAVRERLRRAGVVVA